MKSVEPDGMASTSPRIVSPAVPSYGIDANRSGPPHDLDPEPQPHPVRLGGGRFVAFGVDRDEAVTTDKDAEGGNSADQLGPGLLFPEGVVVGPGMSFRAVMSTGQVLTGRFRNRIGAGWTPVDGFGYINAQAATSGR
jgi:hypothetical protein